MPPGSIWLLLEKLAPLLTYKYRATCLRNTAMTASHGVHMAASQMCCLQINELSQPTPLKTSGKDRPKTTVEVYVRHLEAPPNPAEFCLKPDAEDLVSEVLDLLQSITTVFLHADTNNLKKTVI